MHSLWYIEFLDLTAVRILLCLKINQGIRSRLIFIKEMKEVGISLVLIHKEQHTCRASSILIALCFTIEVRFPSYFNFF